MAAQRENLFINRELSWLEFNRRVLDEAIDPQVPLLERLNFLAISASNLDEFFMVRVGGLQGLLQDDPARRDICGLTPRAQLERITARARRMVDRQYACLNQDLLPALRRAGPRLVSASELGPDDRAHLAELLAEWTAVLTPMAIPTRQPFPLLPNLGLHLAVRLGPEQDGKARSTRFALLPLGNTFNRFIPLPRKKGPACILIEEAIALFIQRFFPGQKIRECIPFRITRNADISVREFLAPDLLTGMQEVLAARKSGECVRLETAGGASPAMLRFLQKGLNAPDERLFEMPGPLGLASFREWSGLEGFSGLTYEPWPPQQPPAFDPRASLFDTLSRGDLLLLHPYERFDPVVKLLEQAAGDPAVLAIKQILYRTSKRSPIISALRHAAENGKYVTVIVELKARFDEARNIEWARELEHAGARVIYGVKGLKTHAKVCIVVRREPQGIARYLHFGTGNYNERTARLYSDVSYLTRDEDLGADASAFFNAVTGYSQPGPYLQIEAAPHGLRARLLELIEGEARRKRRGQAAWIMAKMNSLVDPAIIRALYEASRAGVRIDLNVRGICCLRPGVPGLSERIRVVSIIDRFLEHSRIFCFHHGGDPQVFISSADWMPRNLDRRVELLVPVRKPEARNRLLEVMGMYMKDNVKGRLLRGDGTYERPAKVRRSRQRRSQELLYRAAAERRRRDQPTMFDPHRPAPPEENG